MMLAAAPATSAAAAAAASRRRRRAGCPIAASQAHRAHRCGARGGCSWAARKKIWARAGGTDRRDGARAAIAPSIPHSLVVLQLSGLTGDARQGAQWLCSDRVPPGPANPAGRSSACLQLDAMLGAVAAACGPPGCEHARAPARLAPPRRRHNACRQPTSLSALSRGLSYCQCSGRGDEWIGRELKT